MTSEHGDRGQPARGNGEPKAFTSERLKIYPAISPEKEFARQTRIIIERVVVRLGLSEQDVLAIMPKRFPERPQSFDDSNSVPLIIPKFSGSSWEQTVDAAGFGVDDYLRGELYELSEWQDPRGIHLPDRPYSTWAYVGDDYLRRKPSDVKGEIQKEAEGKGKLRAGDHWDGLGLAVVRPDIVRVKWFDLVGAQVGSDALVCVDWWGGRPGFSAVPVEDADPDFRALVCGSEVST